MGFTAYAQKVQISGTITSEEDGSVLPGIWVVIKGTNTSATTDAEGKYTIKAPADAVLIYSFVGMKTKEIPVAGQTTIDVVLQPDVTNVAEIVVTGIGTATDKRKVAISVESIKSKDLSTLPSASIDQALQGKIAGAQIQSVSGQPGQQSNIIFRGINTLGSTQPMIMIDGVEINTDNNFNGSNNNFSSRLADLDLSNVERIEVVQGAAAATIYGAQGANGVIQIFTKKGTAGKSEISFNSSISSNEILRGNFKFPDKHFYETDEQGYIIDQNGNRLVENAGGVNGQYAAPVGDPNDPTTLCNKPFVEKTYNPLDEIFKKSLTYNNSLSVTGGNNSTTYAIFLSDLKQSSVMRGTYQRINAKADIGSEIFKNFKVNISSTYINTKNTTGSITGQDNTASPLGSAMFAQPYMDMNIRDADGNMLGILQAGDNSTNALFGLENELFSADVSRVIENIDLNYKPFQFLELDYKYGIDDYSYKFQDLIKNQDAYSVFGLTPQVGHIRTLNDKATTQNSIVSAFLNFGKNDLKFKTQLAFDWRSYSTDEIEATVSGIPAEDNINLSSGATPYISEYATEFVTYGYLVNQHIDYKDMLGISGGFRTDYSSAFGKGSKPFTFPRADGYFRVSQLPFWDNIKNVFPELKLRAAYGEAGAQPLAYDRQKTLLRNTIGSQSFLLSKVNQTNEALGIQVSKEFETGLDLKVGLSNSNWLSSVMLSPTYWRKKSDDVIWDVEIPLSRGAVSYKDNAFTLSSHGIQFSMDLNVLKSENLIWDLTTTYGKGTNKVDKISNHQDIVLGNSGSGGFILREGSKVGVFYGYAPLSSVDQTASDGSRYIDPADVGNYEIVNGYVTNKASKQVVYSSEKTVIGDPNPKFTMSFTNNFQIMKFVRFSFQIDWFKGLQVYNQTKQWLYRDANHSDFSKNVTIDGQTGPYTAYWESLYNANDPSSPFVEDGSFVRVREIALAIDLTKLFSIKHVKLLEINFSGHNLFTITKYSGLDPESAANLNDPTQRGLDNFSYPNFKTYTAGLRVNF